MTPAQAAIEGINNPQDRLNRRGKSISCLQPNENLIIYVIGFFFAY